MEYSSPSISVIIPVTNMSGRLQNLETSIQEADPEYFQIIIIHDNRDDETWNELSTLIKKYNKGHLLAINGVYGSAGAARNEGMKYAKNELIAFWDSDDIGSIVSLAQVSRENDWTRYSAVVSSFTRNDEKKFAFDYVLGTDIESNEYAIAAYPGIWRWLFKKDSLRHTFKSYSMGEDQLFLAKNLQSLDISFNSKISYNYFTNVKNQATSDIGLTKIEDLKRVSQEIRVILNQKDISNRSIIKKMDVSINLTLVKHLKGIERAESILRVISKLPVALRILHARRSNEIR
jgi:glycosyltransferase involved in cell wall biosynthesis